MKLSKKIRSATNSVKDGGQQLMSKVTRKRANKVNKEDTLEYNSGNSGNVSVFSDYIDASGIDVGALQNKNDDNEYVLYSNPDVIKKIRDRFYKIDRVVKILYALEILIAALYLFFYFIAARIANSFPWNFSISNDFLCNLHYDKIVNFSSYLMESKDINIQLMFVYFVLITILTLLLLAQFSIVYEFEKAYKLCIFKVVVCVVALLVIGFMILTVLALAVSIALLCINLHKSKVLSGMVLDQEVQLDMGINEDYII